MTISSHRPSHHSQHQPSPRGVMASSDFNNNNNNNRKSKQPKIVPFKKQQSTTKVKHLKFHSASCCSTGNTNGNLTSTELCPKLDPTKPEHARRMEQRRKMINFGKNTVGYDEYIKKVPKNKRRKWSMETPSTPDYTLDIPNKRWSGQVHAWRRALHKYDPPDLQQSLALAAAAAAMDNSTLPEAEKLSVQELQLQEAKARGLLVQIGDERLRDNNENGISPTSVVDAMGMMKELDQWDDNNAEGEDAFLFSDVDDSDDELL